MDRNRWETALRCLEIAVHPNTGDDEVVAAINGFRRTAAGTSLREACREFSRETPTAYLAQWKAELARLERQNRDLRRRLDADDAERRAVVAAHIAEAAERAERLAEELAVAEHRAAAAEQQLAEFRAAYGRVVEGVNHDNFALRWALEEAKRGMVEPTPLPADSPFHRLLTEARETAAPPELASAGPQQPRHPWTA